MEAGRSFPEIPPYSDILTRGVILQKTRDAVRSLILVSYISLVDQPAHNRIDPLVSL